MRARPQAGPGTQIAGVKDGAPVSWPCEEPERTDELRTEVGNVPVGDTGPGEGDVVPQTALKELPGFTPALLLHDHLTTDL
ncbi:hypothetical protein Saso_61940 [Streptomyces asoensis]|uniref:Uncharacterized protein n=1 Tax=Streptomyces asoensis TaxID=249586 RepID=A0ABQ3S8W2_9ACTN|nr:hypothetical protein GCM10010496_40210 [Streptomyces asoensis]GHI64544.1 hypothetical protein Saso_61940 [Streptomyces asoensis]